MEHPARLSLDTQWGVKTTLPLGVFASPTQQAAQVMKSERNAKDSC